MSSNIGTLQVVLKAHTDAFKQGLKDATAETSKFKNKVKSELDSVGLSAEGLRGQFAGLFAGLTVTAAVTSLYNAVNAMDKLNDVADATGASIEGISKLENIALKVGENIGIVETALSKMVVQLKEADGTDNVSKALEAIGLNWKELKSMDPAEGFQKIAVALSGFKDNAEKSQLMAALFGKSFKDLAPYIKDVAENMDMLGTTTAEQAAQAETLKKQLSALTAQYAALQKQVASELLPTLIDIGKAFTSSGDSANASAGQYEFLKTVLTSLSILGVDVAYTFNVMGKEIGVWAAQISSVASNTVTDVQDAITALSKLDFKGAVNALTRDSFKGAFGIGGMGDQWTKESENLRAQRDKTVKAIQDAGKAPAPNLTTNTEPPKANVKFNAKDSADKAKANKGATDAAKAALAAQQEFDKLSASIAESNTAAGLSLSEYSGATATQIELVKEEIKYQKDLESIRSNDKLRADQKEALVLIRTQSNELQKAVITQKNAVAQQIVEQTRLNELLAATPTAQLEKQRKEMQMLAAALEAGKISAKEFSEAASTALGIPKVATEDLSESIIDMKRVAADASSGMADAFLAFATGSKNSFADFARSFLLNIAKMIVQTQILKAMEATMGTGNSSSNSWVNAVVQGAKLYFGGSSAGSTGNGWDGSTSGTSSSGGYWAKGGAFANGSVIPFALGGIVNKPTNFMMSGNRIGLMGEAGPEAIMPLTRVGGKLAVNASGIKGNQTINQVTINVTGGNTNEETGNVVAEKVMRAIARSEISNQRRPGGQLNPI